MLIQGTVLSRTRIILGCALGAALLVSCSCGGSSKSSAQVPRYAYIINFNSTIWTMAEDSSVGALNLAANQVNSGNGTQAMVMDPTHAYLYAANNGANGYTPSLTAYSLTASDHRPVPVTAGVASGANAGVLAMAPSGKFLYVGGDMGIITYQVGFGGVPSQVGLPLASGRTVTGLAVDPSGHFLYASSGYTSAAPAGSDDLVRVYALDATTGVPTATGASYATGANPGVLLVHPSGAALYVMNTSGNTVSQYLRNKTDGTLVAKGTLPATSTWYAMGMAQDPAGKFLYVASYSDSTVTGFRVNADGTLTAMSAPFDAHDAPEGLAVDPDGKFLFTTNDNTLSAFRIDGGTGELTYVGQSPIGGEAHGILIR